MNTLQLVRQLQVDGVEFRVIPDVPVQLQMVDPLRRSTPEQRRQLSADRTDVIAYLASLDTSLTVTSPSPPLDPEATAEFLEERSAIAEYDGQLPRRDAEAQARAELDAIQGTVAPVGPIRCNARLHMATKAGTVTHDPAKCYMWTREVLGFGWWYASEFPPPSC
jgi:hypothetical protein